jgi:hypothetical protein
MHTRGLAQGRKGSTRRARAGRVHERVWVGWDGDGDGDGDVLPPNAAQANSKAPEPQHGSSTHEPGRTAARLAASSARPGGIAVCHRVQRTGSVQITSASRSQPAARARQACPSSQWLRTRKGWKAAAVSRAPRSGAAGSPARLAAGCGSPTRTPRAQTPPASPMHHTPPPFPARRARAAALHRAHERESRRAVSQLRWRWLAMGTPFQLANQPAKVSQWEMGAPPVVRCYVLVRRCARARASVRSWMQCSVHSGPFSFTAPARSGRRWIWAH